MHKKHFHSKLNVTVKQPYINFCKNHICWVFGGTFNFAPCLQNSNCMLDLILSILLLLKKLPYCHIDFHVMPCIPLDLKALIFLLESIYMFDFTSTGFVLIFLWCVLLCLLGISSNLPIYPFFETEVKYL